MMNPLQKNLPGRSASVCVLTAWLIRFGCLSSTARASITLPLEGYCRPGRYFPILVDGPDAASDQHFSADGCAPTFMHAGDGGMRIVPMLVTGNPTSLKTDGHSAIPLHLVDEQQRLIASMNSDISQAIAIFPGRKLISIPLNSSDPLPGSAAAYETLDAVLLDSSSFSRINDSQRSALLAGGVSLIAVGDSPPDTRWPWQRKGAAWVLSVAPGGPVGEVINEDVYAPTFGWSPGWASVLRGQVIGAAALVVLLTIALTLVPKRLARWAVVAFLVASSGAIVAWRRSLGSVSRGGGDVLIAHPGVVQHDQWVYERARETARHITPWAGSTHPLFSSQAALSRSDLKVVMSAKGEMSFQCNAIADHTTAFLRREVLPGTVQKPEMPVDSPMVDAVNAAYLHPGDQITGQLRAGNGRWNSVVIQVH